MILSSRASATAPKKKNHRYRSSGFGGGGEFLLREAGLRERSPRRGERSRPPSRPPSRLRPRSRERSRRLPFPYGRSSRRSSRLGPPRSGPPRPRSRERERERERERSRSRPRRSREPSRRRPPRSSSRSRARYRPLIASSIRSSARYRRFLSTPKMSTSSSFPSGSSRSGVKKQNVFVSRSIERSVAPPEPCTRPAAPRGMRSSVQSSRFSRSGTVKRAARRCFRSQVK